MTKKADLLTLVTERLGYGVGGCEDCGNCKACDTEFILAIAAEVERREAVKEAVAVLESWRARIYLPERDSDGNRGDDYFTGNIVWKAEKERVDKALARLRELEVI